MTPHGSQPLLLSAYHFRYLPIRRRRFHFAIQPTSRTWLVPRLQCHFPTPTTPSSGQFGGKLCKSVRPLLIMYTSPRKFTFNPHQTKALSICAECCTLSGGPCAYYDAGFDSRCGQRPCCWSAVAYPKFSGPEQLDSIRMIVVSSSKRKKHGRNRNRSGNC